MKYGFIGCGNMGGAIAKALSRATKEIMVSDRSGKAEAFAEELGIVYSDAETIAARCDRIFIAVKPHMVQEVLSPLQKVLGKRKPLLITMAAGMEIAKLEQLAGTELPVIRIMPNTPIERIRSATIIAIIPNPHVEILATFINVFSEASGRTLLNMSLVTTPADIFRVALRELAVAKIIPPSIKPSNPSGMASLHIRRYAPSFSRPDNDGL